MILVEVHGLPQHLTAEQLKKLERDVQLTVFGIDELPVKDRTEVHCLFFPGLSETVIMKVIGPLGRPSCTDEIRNLLTTILKGAVRKRFPSVDIVCFVLPSFK